MAAKVEESFELLKAKVGQIDLQKLLPPLFTQLLQGTINAAKVALVLYRDKAISIEEMDQCLTEPTTLYQNLELYKILMKKNAGAALVDALEKTENFHILQLLHSELVRPGVDQPCYGPTGIANNQNLNNFNIPAIGHSKLFDKNLSTSSQQVSILKSSSKIHNFTDNKWTKTIGVQNLSRFQEDTLDFFWARVVTTCDGENCREYFSNSVFSQHIQNAFIPFLESTLHLSLDKKIMARPPRDIYIDTQYFNSHTWTAFTKLLYDFCRDSLETLWLTQVNYEALFQGTNWIKTLNEGRGSYFWFPKLKFFSFQGSHQKLDSATLHNILVLIKSVKYPLQDIWSASGCQVQIWSRNINSCQILMNPSNGILSLDNIDNTLRDEIEFFSEPSKDIDTSNNQQVPIVKLYHRNPGVDSFKNLVDPKILTHLFLNCVNPDNFAVINEVITNLPKFGLLQKLMLWGDPKWEMDLKLLDNLDKLFFLYLEVADVNCRGLGVDDFPWQPSVQTVILVRCHFKLKRQGTSSTLTEYLDEDVMLEINPQQNDGGSQQKIKITKVFREYADTRMVEEFFS